MSAEPAELSPPLQALLKLLGSDPDGADVGLDPAAGARGPHRRLAQRARASSSCATPGAIADLGSGAGLPGLVLAAELPGARVDLIESVSRKGEFLRRAIERMELENAEVVAERAEAHSAAAGREAYDAVTARAVGIPGDARGARLAAASGGGPPARLEGARAIPGRRRSSGERCLRLAMEPVEVRPVTPYPGSRDRHIHLLRKNGPTPNELPRRDGLAAKRPFGAE